MLVFSRQKEQSNLFIISYTEFARVSAFKYMVPGLSMNKLERLL